MKFNIGDRVTVTSPEYPLTNNLHGTIIKTDIDTYDWQYHLISFDEAREGFHDDGDGNYDDHCFWISPRSTLTLEASQFSENDFNNFMEGE